MADNIVISEMSWTEVDEALKQRAVALIGLAGTGKSALVAALARPSPSRPSRPR